MAEKLKQTVCKYMIKNYKDFQKIKHNRNFTSKYQKKIELKTIDFDIGKQLR